MTCDKAAEQIGAWLDGELDQTAAAELERHLEGCAACRRRIDEQRALGRLLTGASRFAASPALRSRLDEALRREKEAAAKPVPLRPKPWRRFALPAASLAGLAASLVLFLSIPSAQDRLADEVVSDHLRSLLMPEHLVDVPSSDQHTIKPWFNGKLEVAPPTPDLSAHGFELIGGRLDYLDHQRSAVVVYKHRQHVINLFVLPQPAGTDRELTLVQDRGYSVVAWTRKGIGHWAVSDLNAADLRDFAELVAAPGK